MSAPVTVVSGLPGHGKTLHTVCFVKTWAEKEKRQVYAHNIEILDKQALPWEAFDPENWHKLPVGAIIVVDEAHKVFPLRPTGSRIPSHVEAIAELRHQGHNLVLITQHPMSLDAEVRRRVGRHIHVVRRYGAQAAAIFEWPSIKENADKTRKGAEQREWAYNKDAYAWYKSAELHTVKRKLPLKLLVFPAAVVALIAAIWSIVAMIGKRAEGVAEPVVAAASAPAFAQQVAQSGTLTPAEYVQRHQPRVVGLDYTAPAYDEVTRPVRAPYPAACVQSQSKGCRCYSQQGTRLQVPEGICLQISEGGFFMAWDDFGKGAGSSVQGSAEALSPAPVSSLPVALSPGHQPRNPVRSGAEGGLAIIGANVSQAGSADGETLAWMRSR